MLKNSFSLILFLGLFFTPSLSLAEVRIAYVDLQQALGESRVGKRAQKSYEKEVIKAQKEIDQKKGEFEQKQKSLKKQRDSLNARALGEKEEELMSLERDVKRAFKDSQEKLRRKNSLIVGDLVKKIRTTVQQIGKEEGYTAILEKGDSALLYADNSIDITDRVVKLFDKETAK